MKTTIKYLLLTLIAIVSLAAISAAAPRIEKSGYHAMQLNQKINREFDKFDINTITQKDGMVRVSFLINENGTITITQSNYSDVKLFEKVQEAFNNIQLPESTDLVGKTFNYNIKFRVGNRQ